MQVVGSPLVWSIPLNVTVSLGTPSHVSSVTVAVSVTDWPRLTVGALIERLIWSGWPLPPPLGGSEQKARLMWPAPSRPAGEQTRRGGAAADSFSHYAESDFATCVNFVTDSTCRLGVLAFGDSITNGGGELQWGVALQSWAMWTARGLGIPYSPYAVDGAVVDDVVELQLPLFERTTANPDGRYELGCLYIGTNDVRRTGFDLQHFEDRLDTALAALEPRCDTLLTATIPLDMGRPRNPELIEQANLAIERSAARHRALVLDLRRFGGRQLMMFDHIHPTALGQIAIAERALDLLSDHGLEVKLRPSELITYETTRWGRLRGDLTYAYRHLKQDAAQRLPLRA